MGGEDEIDSEPPIVQYWHSADLPAEVAELTLTFRDQNPELRHLVLSETEAEKFIDEHFGPREVAAFRACAVPAMQADYFRYCAALALGAVCSDVDVRCRRPLRELLDAPEAGLLFRGPFGEVMNGFFMFKAPSHPLPRLALEMATVGIEQRTSESVWVVTGPWIFTVLAGLHELGSLDAFWRSVAALEHVPSPARQTRAEMLRQRIAELERREPSLKHLLQEIDAHERIAEAFEGVSILPPEATTSWIGDPDAPMSYKSSQMHWARWQSQVSIFRP